MRKKIIHYKNSCIKDPFKELSFFISPEIKYLASIDEDAKERERERETEREITILCNFSHHLLMIVTIY